MNNIFWTYKDIKFLNVWEFDQSIERKAFPRHKYFSEMIPWGLLVGSILVVMWFSVHL